MSTKNVILFVGALLLGGVLLSLPPAPLAHGQRDRATHRVTFGSNAVAQFATRFEAPNTEYSIKDVRSAQFFDDFVHLVDTDGEHHLIERSHLLYIGQGCWDGDLCPVKDKK